MTRKDNLTESELVARRNFQTLVGMILISTLGIVSSVLKPESAAQIMAFCGTAIVAMATIMRGQAEIVVKQSELHEAITGVAEDRRKESNIAEEAKGFKRGTETEVARASEEAKGFKQGTAEESAKRDDKPK